MRCNANIRRFSANLRSATNQAAVSPKRSTYAEDYQDLPQQIGAMVKTFADGYVIAPHSHKRDQLLYSPRGVMRFQTDRTALVVPPDRAVYIPAGLRHSVAMHGAVEMRTLYIAPGPTHAEQTELRVLSVSNLLRELIVALCDEPIVYREGSRGDLIAQLIADELERSSELSLSVPLPRDPRLQTLCAAVLADPSDRRTLERWSDSAGASARTLARLFNSDLGMSFRDWRRRIRFHHALEALTRGETVARAANLAGYRSPSAFTAAFHKIMGAPPSKL